MEFLAMLYTVLLVAICLMLALLLYRGNKPQRGGGRHRGAQAVAYPAAGSPGQIL